MLYWKKTNAQNTLIHFVGRMLEFLSAFAKLEKLTISFVMSVCTFVRLSTWNNLIPTGRIFMKPEM
jgi:hypothetical protein